VLAVADASGMGRPEFPQVAGVWVLVDGRLELSRPELHSQDGAINVDIELGPRDRFLTLVSAIRDMPHYFDWLVFGDPILEMATVERPEAGISGKEVP
jgi:hypothetical protein